MGSDNVCKLLCEHYPERIARWLLKDVSGPVTVLDKELSLEPIRADSVIFLKAQDQIIHLEFQVNVRKSKPPIPFRMLDYFTRFYRLYGMKIIQIVILLKDSPDARALQPEFRCETTVHRFHIVRLWEEDPEQFLQDDALLPLAALCRAEDPLQLLNQVADRVKSIDNKAERERISSYSKILAGLRFKPETIHQIFREGLMRESTIYQEILQEGIQEGHHKGRQEGRQEGLQEGLEKGQQKGRREGEILIISRFLQRKFGEISPELQERIQALPEAQLEELVEDLFDFQNIDDLREWLQKKEISSQGSE